jgi:hypothetical protein
MRRTYATLDASGTLEPDQVPASMSGGVTVSDEGSPLPTIATGIDFVGAGVTASGAGATKTVTIPGTSVADIVDLPTAELTAAKVLAPDGAGGVEFRAETGGASGGTPALVLGTANTPGAAGTFIRTDDTILAFDATAPVTQAFSDAAAAGTATVAARRDHKHGMPANPGASGSLLAALAYTQTPDGRYAVTSASLADLDVTNLAITFTAPASGKVLVRLSAFIYMTTGVRMDWGLREGSSQVGDIKAITLNNAQLSSSVAFLITGISAGSHTYKWAAKVASGTHYVYADATEGQAVMEVWAAP